MNNRVLLNFVSEQGYAIDYKHKLYLPCNFMKNNSNLLPSDDGRSIKNILMIGLFAVVIISLLFSNGLIISQVMASDVNSTSTIDNTSLSIVTNQNTVQAGVQVTLTVTVTDTSSSPTSPTGSVSWSDGGAGGSFSSSACTLSTGTCTTTYTPSSSSPSNVVITASYGGDTTHNTSSSTLSLAISAAHTTTSCYNSKFWHFCVRNCHNV